MHIIYYTGVMQKSLIKRQIAAFLAIALAAIAVWAADLSREQLAPISDEFQQQLFGESTALEVLQKIETKGRAPKTGYARSQFGDGWGKIGGCSVRDVILARDLESVKISNDCKVESGILNDPYTKKVIEFQRGPTSSQAVQIDHVVALSDAWQKGAQQMEFERRVEFSNDPLNLLAVDGPANQSKGDGDAATWLPENKAFRCQYVARQVAIKFKYKLWMTDAEKRAIGRTLHACSG